jgi:hypothetical protein
MQSYQDQVETLRDQLNRARNALGRDLAAAVSAKDWSAFLRDRYDVAALVDHIETIGGQAEFVAKLQAAGDRARDQVRHRGRPRKPIKTAGPAKGASASSAAS